MTGTCSQCAAVGVPVERDHPLLRRNVPGLTRLLCVPCHRAHTAQQHELGVVGDGIAHKAQPPANVIEAAASILVQRGALLRQLGTLDQALGEQLADAAAMISAGVGLSELPAWTPPDFRPEVDE